jgi:3-phenylpropionate/trans-cinnamate dioxygenase ferredoxin component
VPPAKLPVHTHAVVITDGVTHVELSNDKPNLPPGSRTRLNEGTQA